MNINHYLGKPWSNGSDGPDAFDCWGLVRAVYRQRGIVLPVVDVDAHRALEVRHAMRDNMDGWNLLGKPEDYCAVLMSASLRPHHVGVWIPNDGGGVLHSVEGAGVIFNRKLTLKMSGWNLLGFYEWRG